MSVRTAGFQGVRRRQPEWIACYMSVGNTDDRPTVGNTTRVVDIFNVVLARIPTWITNLAVPREKNLCAAQNCGFFARNSVTPLPPVWATVAVYRFPETRYAINRRPRLRRAQTTGLSACRSRRRLSGDYDV